MKNKGTRVRDFYQHYKYYHFHSICFGLGCGVALYSPYNSVIDPSIVGVIFTLLFEIVGVISERPAHTKGCKGPPYDKTDACWGFFFALLIAGLNLASHQVYTLSYGSGIMVFALRGAQRKCSSLRSLKERQSSRR